MYIHINHTRIRYHSKINGSFSVICNEVVVVKSIPDPHTNHKSCQVSGDGRKQIEDTGDKPAHANECYCLSDNNVNAARMYKCFVFHLNLLSVLQVYRKTNPRFGLESHNRTHWLWWGFFARTTNLQSRGLIPWQNTRTCTRGLAQQRTY